MLRFHERSGDGAASAESLLIGRPLVGHPKVGSAAPVSGSAVGALAEAEGAH
jgi:hypothetical protein